MPNGNSEAPFPLQWPEGWARTPWLKRQTHPSFRCTFTAARELLARELKRLRAREIILSSDLPLRKDGVPYADAPRPQDPGVAVYFTLSSSVPLASAKDPAPPQRIALACDRWANVAHNARALGLHVEAMRGMERWGVGTASQAFAGYAALPARGETSRRPWRIVFGVEWGGMGCFAEEDVRETYRELAKSRHPESGGSSEAFIELVKAREEALAELKRYEP